MLRTVLYIIFATALLTLFSCKPESAVSSDSEFQGKWDLVDASRNNRRISTLENATFDFRSDGKMATNVMGDENYYPYSFQNDVITESDGDMLELKIEKLVDDTLVLSSTMRGDAFVLTLTKSAIIESDSMD